MAPSSSSRSTAPAVLNIGRLIRRHGRGLGRIVFAVMVVCQPAGWAGSQRDGSAPSKDGAVIRGLVVTADTGRPLRDAAVSLHPVNRSGPLPASPRSLVLPAHTVAAGVDGTFEMKGIAPGFYRLVATPSTGLGRYLEGRYPDPSADEQVLTIGANQAIDELVIRVPRGSVITGRILDDAGRHWPWSTSWRSRHRQAIVSD